MENHDSSCMFKVGYWEHVGGGALAEVRLFHFNVFEVVKWKKPIQRISAVKCWNRTSGKKNRSRANRKIEKSLRSTAGLPMNLWSFSIRNCISLPGLVPVTFLKICSKCCFSLRFYKDYFHHSWTLSYPLLLQTSGKTHSQLASDWSLRLSSNPQPTPPET